MSNTSKTTRARFPIQVEFVLLLITTAIVYWLLRRTYLNYVVPGITPESTLTNGLVWLIERASVNLLTAFTFFSGLVDMWWKRRNK